MEVPALLTKIPMLSFVNAEKFFSNSSYVCILARSATMMVDPVSIYSLTFSNVSLFLPTKTMSYPAFESYIANSNPIPEVHPVTTAHVFAPDLYLLKSVFQKKFLLIDNPIRIICLIT